MVQTRKLRVQKYTLLSSGCTPSSNRTSFAEECCDRNRFLQESGKGNSRKCIEFRGLLPEQDSSLYKMVRTTNGAETNKSCASEAREEVLCLVRGGAVSSALTVVLASMAGSPGR
eukprot:331440-Prorocentrum_minimum.AAC.3